MKYTVMVDDNFHYMDEASRYELGKFNSLEDARNAAMKIVDDFLMESRSKAKDGRELFSLFCQFGEDPFIVNDVTSQ